MRSHRDLNEVAPNQDTKADDNAMHIGAHIL